MSLSTILIPLAIALAASIPGSVALAVDAAKSDPDVSGMVGVDIGPVSTIFNSASILEKTLREHDLPVARISEDHIVCKCSGVELHYLRSAAGEPFSLELRGVRDPDALVAELTCFEKEYRENVQTYTYEKLMRSLIKHRMTVAEETVLEDNSILITLDVG